jgi:hypothetical protein
MAAKYDWLFTSGPRSKEFNDQDNKKREEILATLLDSDVGTRNSLLEDAPDATYWKTLRKKLVEAIAPILESKSGSSQTSDVFAQRKGGRSQNYDILAFLGKFKDETSGLKIEFKRGKSIYDHPQILSMYATEDFLISKSTESYPSYFYANFISEVEKILGTKKPDAKTYLTKVFQSSPTADPFFEAGYAYAKSGGASTLQDIADDSIANYFAYLRKLPSFLDLSQIQAKLDVQSEKTFLSWDYKTQSFVVETIPLGSLKISGSPRFKASRKGKIHTLVLDTQSGAEVHALLRWKNHPCVQGPAFQIRVTS